MNDFTDTRHGPLDIGTQFWEGYAHYLGQERIRSYWTLIHGIRKWSGKPVMLYYLCLEGRAGTDQFAQARDQVEDRLAMSCSDLWRERCVALGRAPDVRTWQEAASMRRRWDDIDDDLCTHGLVVVTIKCTASTAVVLVFLRFGPYVLIVGTEVATGVAKSMHRAFEKLKARTTSAPDTERR